MLENIDELIDFNLNQLSDLKSNLTYQNITNFGNNINQSDAREILDKMENEELIDYLSTTRRSFKISEKGYKINLNGGWKKHLSIEKEIQTSENNFKKKERRHLSREHILSRWKVFCFWPSFILGMFGGIYGIYDICSQDKYINKEQLKLELLKAERTIINKINTNQKHFQIKNNDKKN